MFQLDKVLPFIYSEQVVNVGELSLHYHDTIKFSLLYGNL